MNLGPRTFRSAPAQLRSLNAGLKTAIQKTQNDPRFHAGRYLRTEFEISSAS